MNQEQVDGLQTTTKQNFAGLDLVRGSAACLVALYHASHLVAEPRYFGVAPWAGTLQSFYTGVDCFFVLSGFLIAWVHWPDVGHPSRVGHYAERRFTRVYPVYWVVLTLVIVLHVVHPAVTNPIPLTLKTVATSFLLLPNSGPTILGVAWTLYFEVTYYVIFGLLICVGRVGLGALGIWIAAIVLVGILAPPQAFPLAFFLNPFNLEFTAGMAMAAMLRQVKMPAPKPFALVAAALFIACAAVSPENLVGQNQLAMRILFGSLACLTIGGLVEAERSEGLRVPSWGRLLGAASYSIYLTHTIVQPPLMQFGFRVLKPLGVDASVAIDAFFSIGVGIIFHMLVEKPLIRAVRTWKRRFE